MLAIVHFAFGMTVGLLLLVPFIDRLNESTVVVFSGIWALIPDLNKFISAADALNGMIGNVFWLHPLIDSLETGHPKIEIFVSLAILCIAVVLVERRGGD